MRRQKKGFFAIPFGTVFVIVLRIADLDQRRLTRRLMLADRGLEKVRRVKRFQVVRSSRRHPCGAES